MSAGVFLAVGGESPMKCMRHCLMPGASQNFSLSEITRPAIVAGGTHLILRFKLAIVVLIESC